MSGSPTNVNLNDTVPAPKPDSANVEWQAGNAYPDPNSPGQYIRDTSACYRFPPVGGVFVIDDTIVSPYQLSINDSGQTLVVNTTGAITLQLPSAIPSFKYLAQGVWNVKIKVIGSGTVTIDPNGLNCDGSSSTFTVPKGTGFELSTDGTGYYTWGNFGLSQLVYDVFTGDGSTTAFTLTKSPAGGKAIVFWNAGGGAVLPTDYSISGTTLTTSFKDAGGNSTPAQSGEKIYVVYFV
jgi:hypothetical protein